MGLFPTYNDGVNAASGEMDGVVPTMTKSQQSLLSKVKGLITAGTGALGMKKKFKMPTLMSCFAFVNPTAFGKPANFTDATRRLRTNLRVYTPNYVLTGLFLSSQRSSPAP